MNIEALQRLARDEQGNLTPMFALTLLPVLGLVGITSTIRSPPPAR
jgi:Flp pilus assembly protein TadG